MARVLVLANSRKTSGRCVAGIDLESGSWVRPVSNRPNGELDLTECTAIRPDGSRVGIRPGDVVEMSLGAQRVSPWHPEDVLLTGSFRAIEHWPAATIEARLPDHIDTTKYFLGSPGDRLSVAEIMNRKDHYSLQLVKVSGLKLHWTTSMSGAPQLRSTVVIRGSATDLPVTDVAAESALRGRQGIVEVAEALATISLGTPFLPRNSSEKFCFKLIAAVLPLRAGS